MLTRDQKAWMILGYCAREKNCDSCRIGKLCDSYDHGFLECTEAELNECLGIIAPELVGEPKRANPEPTGLRFTLSHRPLTSAQVAETFIHDLTRATREGFRPISSGVCIQHGTPCAWAIMSRPETPEEAKEASE